MKQLKDSEKREKYKVYGELINAFGYGLTPDDKFLEAANYYDDNKIIKIPIDNTKTPTDNAPLVMIEYSSPNTNKPLHLGHVRNNLLGNALANIISANGNRVVKTNIVNDRGIHICKSMLAWQKYGNGETPESSGKKGDHLIGDYYVAFDKHYKAEVKELMAKFQSEGMSEEEAKAKAEAESPLMKEAREMLVKWEAGEL